MLRKFRLKLVYGFIFSLFIHAFSFAMAKEINIPSQFGSTKEIFQPANPGPSAERTIIHIQDAHCNYEAQKNMAQLLDYLAKDDNLKLIMVEGGSGDVSLRFLRGYADKKAREQVAEKYLKAGKISGEEYLDIVSDHAIELYGIEDEGLYEAHLASFQKVDSFRQKALQDLGALAGIVNGLKFRIYPEDLRRLDEQKSSYEGQKTALAEYCRFLNNTAAKKRIGLGAYPHLGAFSETARLEKELDLRQAEAQRNAFIKDLAKLLNEREAQNLILMTQGFKAKMITPEKYYSFLLDTATEQKINLSRRYPELGAYIRYVTTSGNVDAAELLKEVNAAEEKIKDASLSSPEQKKLSEIDKSLHILTKILNLELTPEDYAYFKENTRRFMTAGWIGFLNEECDKYNFSTRPFFVKAIDENLKELDGFYRLGVAREEAFINNLAAKLDDSKEKTAALITGGFHTPGITRNLKNRGYSYIVVTPVITQKSEPDLYFSVLRSEKRQPVRVSDEE